MGRYPKAPYDFTCLYHRSCPYMDGISATWAHLQVQEANRLNEEYWQLSDMYRDEVDGMNRTIKTLEQENTQLKAQLKTLHQRQFKANRKSRTTISPPNQDHAEKPRPRGALRGILIGQGVHLIMWIRYLMWRHLKHVRIVNVIIYCQVTRCMNIFRKTLSCNPKHV